MESILHKIESEIDWDLADWDGFRKKLDTKMVAGGKSGKKEITVGSDESLLD